MLTHAELFKLDERIEVRPDNWIATDGAGRCS